MFARVPFRQPDPVSPIMIAGFRPLFDRSATHTIISNNFADLSRIYEDGVNLCLIERPLPATIEKFVYQALQTGESIEISQPVDPQYFDFNRLWTKADQLPGYQDWLEDVKMLVTAFCELFDRREAGLRIRTLDKAMCPRFHVDRVPARLICSYGGIGTEWLPEYALNRHKLGMGSCGVPDAESGLIADPTAIRQMPAYAVGLMKGENWDGNEGHGLVHRSPQPTAVQPRRLLLTLDML
jgi:hypothetical protein